MTIFQILFIVFVIIGIAVFIHGLYRGEGFYAFPIMICLFIIALMKKQFVDKGIPVVIGEFGATRRDNLTSDALKLHLASMEAKQEFEEAEKEDEE